MRKKIRAKMTVTYDWFKHRMKLSNKEGSVIELTNSTSSLATAVLVSYAFLNQLFENLDDIEYPCNIDVTIKYDDGDKGNDILSI